LSAARTPSAAIPKLAKVLEWRMRRRLAIHGAAGNCSRARAPVVCCERRAGGAGDESGMMNPKAEDLAVRVWFRFIRLESRLQIAVSERLREIGLSVPQCDVLTTLTEAEGVSQQDLAKRLYVTKGNISGLLDRLEGAGLVERRSTAADRRQYEIYLTPAGREAAERAICIQHELIGATLGRLPAEDLAAFENLLIATRDLFRAQGGRVEAESVAAGA
jgi:MarR family transcriptional regulator, organic hydroperoxide resistance regulator